TVGTGRGAPGTVRRGGQWSGTLRACDPQGRSRVPHREDVRGLGPRGLLDPDAHPTSPSNPGVDRAPREPGGLRTLGDREDVPARGTRPPSGRGRTEGRLVHPRRPRGAAAPSPRG